MSNFGAYCIFWWPCTRSVRPNSV